MIGRCGRTIWAGCTAWVAGLAFLYTVMPVQGQDASGEPPLVGSDVGLTSGLPVDEPVSSGCSSCGGYGDYLNPNPVDDEGWSACGSKGCVGHRPCYHCKGKSCCGRFLGCIYQCICCPDPCYEPHWQPIADAAFFTHAIRPITQTRFRLDSGINMIFPDRATYFWARQNQLGPVSALPLLGEISLNYNELSMYTEVASKRFSIFFEMPYRSLDPETTSRAAGFGDIKIGHKTLLFDCELLQISMQMTHSIPAASPVKGLGNGHFSTDIAMLFGLKLTPDTYLQAEVGEWIPIGGDSTYQGAILHYHMSLNQVLFRIVPDVPLVFTSEFSGWSFQTGSYTDPFLGPQPASGYTYFYAGAGLRLFICNKIDFGVGSHFSLQEDHWAETLIRSEFRLRY